VRNSLTAIGRGSTIAGLLLVAASRGTNPRLLLAGQILIGVGIVLLIVYFWQRSRSR